MDKLTTITALITDGLSLVGVVLSNLFTFRQTKEHLVFRLIRGNINGF